MTGSSDPSARDLLATRLAAARDEWAGIEVEDDQVIAFIEARIPPGASRATAIARMSISDLYIACACELGVRGAAESFQQRFRPAILSAVARVDSTGGQGEDLLQDLFARLFIDDGTGRRKIAHYAGKGELVTWLRVVAGRMAIDRKRMEMPQAALSDSLIAQLDDGEHGDPQLALLQRTAKHDLKAALEHAISTLTARQRTVLRYLLDGKSAEEVGRIYKVHRVTVARWLGSIRQELHAATRAALRAQPSARDVELDSILRAASGQLSLSIDRLIPRNRK